MRKLYQSPDQKRYQQKRARKEAIKHSESTESKSTKSPKINSPKRLGRVRRKKQIYYPNPKNEVKAPIHLSFVGNTDETCHFLNQLRRAGEHHAEVYISLLPVKTLTSDALTVLLSVVLDVNEQYGTKWKIIAPQNKHAKRFLQESGFTRIIQGNNPEVETKEVTGGFWKRTSNKVEPRYASEVIRGVLAQFCGEDETCIDQAIKGAIYRTILECMSNTKGHADPKGVKLESWWLSYYCEPSERRARFSFVDTGIGIINSANVGHYRKIKAKLGIFYSVGDIMRDVFNGQIPSRTKKQGRGEGLPAMRVDCCERCLISNLTVITNSVKSEIARDVHTPLRNNFSGTFIYWELRV